MNKKQQSFDIILKQKMLPLYFNADKQVSIDILKALYHAGIRSVEYTNRGTTALENFKALIMLRNEELPGMELGIGTIKTIADAQAFIAAGADYIICPGLIPDVVKHVQDAGLLCVPGCMTTSEIIAAEQLGVTFIKLFPGNLIGPGYVSAIRDIFPDLFFMPTGGVDTTKENIQSWFDAGVCAVGMGSKLISKSLMENRNYIAIQKATQEVLAIAQSTK
jgi:2-dehydro-3-deoxyphosphogluconate aldolase/(4S)-4-hydroxy-2-oxoglutarate aldolase